MDVDDLVIIEEGIEQLCWDIFIKVSNVETSCLSLLLLLMLHFCFYCSRNFKFEGVLWKLNLTDVSHTDRIIIIKFMLKFNLERLKE